jgi:hypothetical protein
MQTPPWQLKRCADNVKAVLTMPRLCWPWQSCADNAKAVLTMPKMGWPCQGWGDHAKAVLTMPKLGWPCQGCADNAKKVLKMPTLLCHYRYQCSADNADSEPTMPTPSRRSKRGAHKSNTVPLKQRLSRWCIQCATDAYAMPLMQTLCRRYKRHEAGQCKSRSNARCDKAHDGSTMLTPSCQCQHFADIANTALAMLKLRWQWCQHCTDNVIGILVEKCLQWDKKNTGINESYFLQRIICCLIRNFSLDFFIWQFRESNDLFLGKLVE